MSTDEGRGFFDIVGIRTSVQIKQLKEKTTFKFLNIYQN